MDKNVNDSNLENNAIILENVTKVYPGTTALDNISFSVKKGSVHAFLGPNGAGKSTTMKIITGLIPPSSGRVQVSSKIGFLPELPPVYSNMTVKDYLLFVGKIQTLKNHKELRVDEVVKRCGLQDVYHRLIGNLSKGYRQRVGIAQALIFSPEIVILDEPTVGLDPQAIAEIRDLILELKKDHTILLSTHQLHEASLICNDVTIINKGKILRTGTLEDVQKSFHTKQVLKAVVKVWNADIEQKIREHYQFENIESEALNDDFKVIFSSSSNEDLRSSLLEKLIHAGASPLELNEVRLDLEDIFKRITAKELQS